MNEGKLQRSLDIIAISISAACTIHCLAMPIIIILFPILTSTILGDELFHQLMVWIILPTSMSAFFFGCKQHEDRLVILQGIVGFALLVYAAFWGHEFYGEIGEKLITLMGGLLMALAHFRNYLLCRKNGCHQ